MIINGFIKENYIYFTANQVPFGHILIEDCIADAVRDSVKFKIIDDKIEFIQPMEDWIVEEFDRERLKRATKVFKDTAAIQSMIPFDFKAISVYDRNGNFKIQNYDLDTNIYRDINKYYNISREQYQHYNIADFDTHVAIQKDYYIYESLCCIYEKVMERGYITLEEQKCIERYCITLGSILNRLDKYMLATLVCFNRYLRNKLNK